MRLAATRRIWKLSSKGSFNEVGTRHQEGFMWRRTEDPPFVRRKLDERPGLAATEESTGKQRVLVRWSMV